MRYVDLLLAGSGWNWFFVVLMMEYWSVVRWDVTYCISCRSAATWGCAHLCVALVATPHKCAGNHQLLINTMWPCTTVVQGHVVLISSWWLPAHLWGDVTRTAHKRAQPHVPADLQLMQYFTSHLTNDQHSIFNTTKTNSIPTLPAASQHNAWLY